MAVRVLPDKSKIPKKDLLDRVPHPNFFIVGAARSATESLRRYLKQHPDVFMPANKEPTYFCELANPGLAEFAHFDAYLQLFAGAGGAKALGEASVSYLWAPESAALIRATFPDAKIIILLRNPAQRAYSQYCLACGHGVEWMPTFERALAEEDRRYENEDFIRDNPFLYYVYLYFRTSLYADNVQRYLNVFPREQIRILLYDDLSSDPVKVTQGVYEFLGVDRGFVPKVGVHNISRLPLSVRAQYVIRAVGRRFGQPSLFMFAENGMVNRSQQQRRRDARLVGRMRGIVRRACRAAARTNHRLGKYRKRRLKPSTKRELLERYREDVRRTSELIGRNLDSWLTDF